ncbi:hypothetical protein ACRQ5D_34455 [Mucilaginibacter sp. P25]|uniref:hypothetical protein n=1 Tax=Mucilaginibacter sp. P25 TaxID=3423945 RepID=UPI003D7BC2AD
MYKAFELCGFPTDEFYADSDTSLDGYLEKLLHTSNLPIQVLAVDFLSLIVPGGSVSVERKEYLQNLFYNYDNKKYDNEFKAIETIVTEWAECNHYDAEEYIKRFLLAINVGPTWITYRDNAVDFPKSGYFTDTPFTIEELQKVFDAS